MAKGGYVGVGGVARKLKKAYVGVGGAARKIKKGYVGIGGVARLCWSGELAYYGKAPDLSAPCSGMKSANAGNYVLFAGGGNAGSPSGGRNIADAYSNSLTKIRAAALTEARGNHAGTENGNYALFAGGLNATTTFISSVDAYDSSLTKSTPAALGEARYALAGARVGNHALFAGGWIAGSETGAVDAYNDSLTKSTPVSISPRNKLAGGYNSAYAIFVGGARNDNESTVVEAYNASLTKTTLAKINSGGAVLKTPVNTSKYAWFGGGENESTSGASDNVLVYDTSLTRSMIHLSSRKQQCAGARLGNCVIFAGGSTQYANSYMATVDVFDESLTAIPMADLQEARESACGGSIGDYALIAGGNTTTNAAGTKTSVEVYSA